MPKLYPVIWIDSKDYVTSQVQHLTEQKGAKSLIEARTSLPMFTQAGSEYVRLGVRVLSITVFYKTMFRQLRLPFCLNSRVC